MPSASSFAQNWLVGMLYSALKIALCPKYELRAAHVPY
jgi:hypothetical protein